MIAGDLALSLDPVLLAERVGIAPDPWQRDLLRSTAPRILLNASRQVGKSTITGILATHTALYSPSSPIILISPSLRQSGELFRKCLDCYRAAGRPAPADSETKLTLELANGSRIISLPGSETTIRGYSGVALLVKVLLEQRRLQVVKALPEASTLVDELMTYQQTTSASGYTSFNAREGKHDDLILAVAITAWLAERSGQLFLWSDGDLDDE